MYIKLRLSCTTQYIRKSFITCIYVFQSTPKEHVRLSWIVWSSSWHRTSCVCKTKNMHITCMRHEMRKCANWKICVFFRVCMGDVNSKTAICEWSVRLACNTYIQFMKGVCMASFTMNGTYRLVYAQLHLRLSRTTATYTRLSTNSCTTGREQHIIGSSLKFHTLPFGVGVDSRHMSV